MLITFFFFDFRPIGHNSNLRQNLAYVPILRIWLIFYAKIWRMLILVKICMGAK